MPTRRDDSRRRPPANRDAPRTPTLRRAAEPAGRAWINGREVGGTNPRWSHLARSYD